MTLDRFGRKIRAGAFIAWPRRGSMSVGVVKETPDNGTVQIACLSWPNGRDGLAVAVEEQASTTKPERVIVLSPITVPDDYESGILHEMSRFYASGRLD